MPQNHAVKVRFSDLDLCFVFKLTHYISYKEIVNSKLKDIKSIFDRAPRIGQVYVNSNTKTSIFLYQHSGVCKSFEEDLKKAKANLNLTNISCRSKFKWNDNSRED